MKNWFKGSADLKKPAASAPKFGNISKDSKVAIAEIIVNKVDIKGGNFSIELQLRLTTPENIKQPFKLVLPYRGIDHSIKNYIIKKKFSPIITFLFLGFTLCLFISPLLINRLKKYGMLKEENVSFYFMGILSYIIAISGFLYLTYLKHNILSSTAFFKGAEVHFFVDTNTGLYFEPKEKGMLNFTQITTRLSQEIFDDVSSKLYMGRSLSEKLSDSLLYYLNRLIGGIDPDAVPIKEFVELKKSDYFYKFYTFAYDEHAEFDKLKPLSEGRFGEITMDFNKNLTDIRRIHRENRGQSSLIKPLMQLIKMLEEKETTADDRKMKRFIIILTDADEGYEENIKELLKRISYFYKKKDQYLRVFAILYPNLPKAEDKIYYSETGKLVLLSKIYEMIVNLNANKSFNVEKFKAENQRYYKNLHITMDKDMEEKYNKKLDELKIFMDKGFAPSIDEIASQRTLMDYIRDKERQYMQMIQASGNKSSAANKKEYQDFFIYTFANNMYCLEHVGNSMTSVCDNQTQDCKCDGLEFSQKDKWINNEDLKIDYNFTRSKYFSLADNKKNLKALKLISDVFVDQFIFIGYDKEQLAAAVTHWLPLITSLLGLIFAWLLYRYKYHVNYKFSWHRLVADGFIVLLIAVTQIFLYLYIQYDKAKWIIYGNFLTAFIISLVFAICVYILPQAINLLLLSRISDEKDILFSFEQPAWLRNIDRYLFDFILLPIMTISIFIIIGLPVLKAVPTDATGIFKYYFLLDYQNMVDTFFVVWSIIGIFFIIRSLIYSNKLLKNYRH